MKQITGLLIILCLYFNVTWGQESYPEPKWQIISSKYPTKNTIIAGYSVTEFGAKGDGITNDTQTFQQANPNFYREGKFVIETIKKRANSLFINRIKYNDKNISFFFKHNQIAGGGTLKLYLTDKL